MNGVCEKLQISPSQLNALYTPCPVDGWRGEEVEALLRERFGLGDNALGEALVERGILTEEEGRWLDDLD